jgi:hypothetical protein
MEHHIDRYVATTIITAGLLVILTAVLALFLAAGAEIPAAAAPIREIPDEWSVMYRCRRCAKVFYESGQLKKELSAGRLLKVHDHCGQDVQGLADLIGGLYHIEHFNR